MNIWEVLEIEPTKDIDIIKQAYARLLGMYHPEEYPEKFQQIQHAYKVALSLTRNTTIAYKPIIFDTKDVRYQEQDNSSIFVEQQEEDTNIESTLYSILEHIDEILMDGTAEDLKQLFNSERIREMQSSAIFIEQLCLLLQLRNAYVTYKNIDVLKIFYARELRRYTNRTTQRFLKVLTILDRSAYSNEEKVFYYKYLGTKNPEVITAYQNYIEERMFDFKVAEDYKSIALQFRLAIIQTCRDDIYKLLKSQRFIESKDDGLFIEELCDVLEDLGRKGVSIPKETIQTVLDYFKEKGCHWFPYYVLQETMVKCQKGKFKKKEQNMYIEFQHPNKEERNKAIVFIIIVLFFLMIGLAFTNYLDKNNDENRYPIYPIKRIELTK